MRLEDLAPAGISFVVVALVLGIGADVLSTVNASQTANSTAADVTLNGTAGIGELASWLPTIALVLAAAVIIGVVVSYFSLRN